MALFALAGAVALSGFVGGSAVATSGPPPGWTAEAWAGLPPHKQEQELQAYPPPADMEAKMRWLETNPEAHIPGKEITDAADDDGPSTLFNGISESAGGPVSFGYVFTNSWHGLDHGGSRRIHVYAGADASDRQQGVLVVALQPWPATEATPTDHRFFPTARRLGPLQIVRVTQRADPSQSAMILFRMGTAKAGSFDLATMSYVNE